MKHIFKIKLILTVVFFMSITGFAQKFKVIEGNTKALKGESQVNLEYDYSKMGVGKFKDEADYIAKKKAEYNKKEEGRGDKWEKSWIEDREKRFQPHFEELFNKHSKLSGGNFSSAKYTLIVKTTFTEPGFNVHVSRKNASIDGELWIVETANKSNVIAKISFKGAPGRTFGGYDYDSGVRIQESYAVLGKNTAKYLSK